MNASNPTGSTAPVHHLERDHALYEMLTRVTQRFPLTSRAVLTVVADPYSTTGWSVQRDDWISATEHKDVADPYRMVAELLTDPDEALLFSLRTSGDYRADLVLTGRIEGTATLRYSFGGSALPLRIHAPVGLGAGRWDGVLAPERRR